MNNTSWLCLVLTSSIFMEWNYLVFTYAGGKDLSELRRLFADILQVRVWSWVGPFGTQCHWDRFLFPNILFYRSQWPRGLMFRSEARRLLDLWVRIPPGAWISVLNVVSCQVYVLCDGPILLPEKCYRVCVCVCVSLIVIRCNRNPLHLGWLCRRVQTKDERYFGPPCQLNFHSTRISYTFIYHSGWVQ